LTPIIVIFIINYNWSVIITIVQKKLKFFNFN